MQRQRMFVSNVLLVTAAIMLRLSIEIEKEKNQTINASVSFFLSFFGFKRGVVFATQHIINTLEKKWKSHHFSHYFCSYITRSTRSCLYIHKFASISITNVIILYSSFAMHLFRLHFLNENYFFIYLHIHLCERVRYAFSTSLSSKFQKSHQKQISCGIEAVMRLPKSLYPILTSLFFSQLENKREEN